MTVDLINHPPHYTSSPAKCDCGRPIECIDVTRHMGFNAGNVVKYLWREGLKGAPLADLRKAQWYLADLIKERERANTLPREGLPFEAVKAERDAARDEAVKWHGVHVKQGAAIFRRPCDCGSSVGGFCTCPTARVIYDQGENPPDMVGPHIRTRNAPTAPHSAAPEGHKAPGLGMGSADAKDAWAGRISGGEGK